MSKHEKRQITLDEIKTLLGYGDWTNNSFANALCCIINDAIDHINYQAYMYMLNKDKELEKVYRDSAEILQNRKNDLHDALDELGVYDK